MRLKLYALISLMCLFVITPVFSQEDDEDKKSDSKELTLEDLPQYTDEELKTIVQMAQPEIDFSFPKILVEPISGNNRQINKIHDEEKQDTSYEIFLYGPQGNLMSHTFYEKTRSIRMHALYYDFDLEHKTISRRVLNLRTGIEYAQTLEFYDNNFTQLQHARGFMIHMQTDGALGDFSFSFNQDGTISRSTFWHYDIDHLGRRTKGYLFMGGRLVEFREFFYEGISRDRQFIRFWHREVTNPPWGFPDGKLQLTGVSDSKDCRESCNPPPLPPMEEESQKD